jgi:hypothetical protein
MDKFINNQEFMVELFDDGCTAKVSVASSWRRKEGRPSELQALAMQLA